MNQIIAFAEPQQQTRRHPWRCQQLSLHHARCGALNRASAAYCCACGTPYHQERRYQEQPGSGLAESLTMAESLAEYQTLDAEARKLFGQLAAIEERLGVLFLSQRDPETIETIDLHSAGRHHCVTYSEPDEVLGRAQRQIWGALVARSGIYRILSEARSKEVDTQLSEGDLPPLTVANVESWLVNMQGSAEELLREKVAEVFKFLRPAHTDYKTNSVFEVGKKVVLENVICRSDARWSWSPRVNHYYQAMLTSLETLFRTLDGQGERTTGWKSDLHVAIESCDPESGKGETDYFRVKPCRNGNLHLEFKRLDLLAKFNAVAGGKNLKGARRTKETKS